VKCGEGNTNLPELLLLKNFSLAYHHSHFLAATFDFTSFFTMAFLGLHPFFKAGLFWIRYNYPYTVLLIFNYIQSNIVLQAINS